MDGCGEFNRLLTEHYLLLIKTIVILYFEILVYLGVAFVAGRCGFCVLMGVAFVAGRSVYVMSWVFSFLKLFFCSMSVVRVQVRKLQ